MSIILLTLGSNAWGQEVKEDPRPQSVREDQNNVYRADDMTTLDVLQALQAIGIQVKKFDLGEFDQLYSFTIFADEYKNGKLVKTDTLLEEDNQYHYYPEEGGDYFLDYMDQIKVVTLDAENESTLNFHTYKVRFKEDIKLEKTDDRQFFVWRRYKDTHWKKDQKVPLMLFGSSWEDKTYGFHRFCGVVSLEENTPATQELLDYSPNYIVISYQVSDMPKTDSDR